VLGGKGGRVVAEQGDEPEVTAVLREDVHRDAVAITRRQEEFAPGERLRQGTGTSLARTADCRRLILNHRNSSSASGRAKYRATASVSRYRPTGRCRPVSGPRTASQARGTGHRAAQRLQHRARALLDGPRGALDRGELEPHRRLSARTTHAAAAPCGPCGSPLAMPSSRGHRPRSGAESRSCPGRPIAAIRPSTDRGGRTGGPGREAPAATKGC
jgi:hypothetical protein